MPLRRTAGIVARVRVSRAAILFVMCLAIARPVSAGTQARLKQPDAWFLTVSHRIDLAQRAPDAFPQTGQPGRKLINLTSGILVDSDGHVVTRLVNLDPTLAQQDLKVTTSTGKILTASFVGLDGPTGLAVLSVPELRGRAGAQEGAQPSPIDGTDVHVVSPYYPVRQISVPIERVALYPELRIVDATIVGASTPAALKRTGVLSAIESRQLSTTDDLSTVESTDGKLVGLVRYLSPGRGDVLSLGFVRDVVAPRVIKAGGSVQAGWLGAVGMSLREVPADRRPAWAAADGVLIEMISAKGPADSAGLQLNDLVLSIDGIPVRSTSELATIVTATPAGTRIEVDVLRDGASAKVTPVLGGKPLAIGAGLIAPPSDVRYAELRKLSLQNQLARSKDEAARARITEQIAQVDREIDLMRSASRAPAGTGVPVSASGIGSLGITVRTAPSQVAEHSGVKAGLFVDDVVAGGKADAAGLRATDIIVQVGGIKVADPASFDGAVRAAAASGAAFVDIAIVRDRQPSSVRVQLAAPAKKP
ncbi:MAG TPA: PDZ domain-containing protein [Blastocatellia bacterium]|nr:PDZ domain-containing protein [Blastocatellia bacterium]